MDLKKITKEILSQSYNITTEAGGQLVVIESGDVLDILKRLASDGVLADVRKLCDHSNGAVIETLHYDRCTICGEKI